MSNYETMVAKAILADPRTEEGKAERELQMARITCKMAASHHMFCRTCGAILDQKKVVVITAAGRGCSVYCSDCAVALTPEFMQGVADTIGDQVNVETWDGLATYRPKS